MAIAGVTAIEDIRATRQILCLQLFICSNLLSRVIPLGRAGQSLDRSSIRLFPVFLEHVNGEIGIDMFVDRTSIRLRLYLFVGRSCVSVSGVRSSYELCKINYLSQIIPVA